MSVYYKWRNAPTFKSIKVDGDGISVADFKAEISSKMGTGESDLLITAEGTGHEYRDDNERIPKNSSLTVSRRATTRSSNPVTANARSINPTQEEEAEGAEQREKLQEILKMQNEAWAPMNAPDLSGVAHQRQFAGPRLTQGADGKYYAQGANNAPPEGYRCHRCGQGGHWIKYCPTNGDPNFDIKRTKKSTGIPQNYLVAVDASNRKGAFLNAKGQVSVFKPNEGDFSKTVGVLGPRHANAAQAMAVTATQQQAGAQVVPDHLRCPLDGRLFDNAVLVLCCTTTYCESCIKSVLNDKDPCPNCKTPAAEVTMTPHHQTRKAVEAFRASGGAGSAQQLNPMLGMNAPGMLRASASGNQAPLSALSGAPQGLSIGAAGPFQSQLAPVALPPMLAMGNVQPGAIIQPGGIVPGVAMGQGMPPMMLVAGNNLPPNNNNNNKPPHNNSSSHTRGNNNNNNNQNNNNNNSNNNTNRGGQGWQGGPNLGGSGDGRPRHGNNRRGPPPSGPPHHMQGPPMSGPNSTPVGVPPPHARRDDRGPSSGHVRPREDRWEGGERDHKRARNSGPPAGGPPPDRAPRDGGSGRSSRQEGAPAASGNVSGAPVVPGGDRRPDRGGERHDRDRDRYDRGDRSRYERHDRHDRDRDRYDARDRGRNRDRDRDRERHERDRGDRGDRHDKERYERRDRDRERYDRDRHDRRDRDRREDRSRRR